MWSWWPCVTAQHRWAGQRGSRPAHTPSSSCSGCIADTLVPSQLLQTQGAAGAAAHAGGHRCRPRTCNSDDALAGWDGRLHGPDKVGGMRLAAIVLGAGVDDHLEAAAGESVGVQAPCWPDACRRDRAAHAPPLRRRAKEYVNALGTLTQPLSPRTRPTDTGIGRLRPGTRYQCCVSLRGARAAV